VRPAQRWALGLLCVSALAVAVPALFAPADFFRSFPLGRGWVRELPPYNEHLTRDVGGLYLGFAVLFAWAAVTLERALVLPLCVAWCVFSAAHLAFHASHADGARDAALQLASLAAVLVLGAAVAWVAGADRATR
jgi:hypothetical protein